MVEWLTQLMHRYFNLPVERTERILRRMLVGVAAAFFVLLATLLVAWEDVVPGLNDIRQLQPGNIAPRTITAPATVRPFVSQILTDEARQQARENVAPRYSPPDPNVLRQQTQLAQQIIDFIDNVRRDPYGTLDEKVQDVRQIIALTLDDRTIIGVLQTDDETWSDLAGEVSNVLTRIMRESIQPDQLQTVRDQLSIQVSVRFDILERDIIVALLEDLIRPNTFENPEATEAAREAAAQTIQPVTRRFVRGESIIEQGEIITAADFEALEALGLLRPDDLRAQNIGRAFVASVLVLVLIGLYIARYTPNILQRDTRMFALIAVVFLGILAGGRLVDIGQNFYVYPAVAMALLYVAIAGHHVAIITSLGLALLLGLMSNNSLEVATFIAAGGIAGTLVLRRVDRLNSFFMAGALVGVINAAIVGLFSLGDPTLLGDTSAAVRLLGALLSGAFLVPAVAFAILYVVTQIFNLPTVIKLLDLSQPSKPLLQRLLREAPGSYQHSLQVANLAEQAAHAIGADAQLTHVAALYHDIGKILNPLYFTENQQDIANPHDTLNDPYRSADIIIGHITEGDEMARQYRLPQRLRDFIREHHGTTQVFYFYQDAINRMDGDAAAVDIDDFTYPGPRPQTKETAILMLADSCEATVRSMKPSSKQEIQQIVTRIFNEKRDAGQLDECPLTLNDLLIIRQKFVEILQSMFHPRINYQEAINQKAARPRTTPATTSKSIPKVTNSTNGSHTDPGLSARVTIETASVKAVASVNSSEEEPLPEVPRLNRSEDKRSSAESTTINREAGQADSLTHNRNEDDPDTPEKLNQS